MGYDTYYGGEIEIDPPITMAEAEAIVAMVEAHNWSFDLELESDDRRSVLYGRWMIGFNAITTPDESTRDYDIEIALPAVCQALRDTGHYADGEVYWDGEESDDRGVIEIKKGICQFQRAIITYPEWTGPEPTIDVLRHEHDEEATISWTATSPASTSV